MTQLQSHFLFNTLNDAAELVHVDPQAADDVITRLSEFLRAASRAEAVHQRSAVGRAGAGSRRPEVARRMPVVVDDEDSRNASVAEPTYLLAAPRAHARIGDGLLR